MTRLSLLEDQKAILTVKKEALESKRGDIYVREQKALGEALAGFYGVFPEDVEVEVTRGSVYFKMAHPDVNYKKELFSLYLRENWNFEEGKDKRSYTGIDLSYYTTSTKGDDVWELKRLRMLGDVADILIKNQQNIVDTANDTVDKFKEEFNEVYGKMNVVGNSIRDLSNQIREIQKQIKKIELFGEGIQFEKSRCITLKHNYEPRVVSLKLIEVSKSGKKATAVFEWEKGRESREEGVNVEKIIYQVI
jgi:hypothetical protein